MTELTLDQKVKYTKKYIRVFKKLDCPKLIEILKYDLKKLLKEKKKNDNNQT